MISILLLLHFASISILAISVLNFERRLSLELCENAQRSFGEMRQSWTALGSFLREFNTHAPVVQKIADQRWLIAYSAKKYLFI